MSLENEFRKKMNDALKAGNKEEHSIYSSIVVAIVNKKKDLRVECLDEEQEIEVLTRMAKQNKESIDTCPKNRTDILDELIFERSILTKYLPEQMTEDEIVTVVNEVLSDIGIQNPTLKDRGKIMKVLMPRVKGRADGKIVNQILMNHLS